MEPWELHRLRVFIFTGIQMDRLGILVVKKNLHVKCAITNVGEKNQYWLTPLCSTADL